VDKISLGGEETSVLESRGRHGQEPRQMEEKPDWIDVFSPSSADTPILSK